MSAIGNALADSALMQTHSALGPRARSKQKTRAAIIAKSLQLFSTRGYDVVTTQEIADAVGVTQRTLFRYFERKDSIIYASQYNYVARFEIYLEHAFIDLKEPYDAVQAGFNQLAVYFSENREIIASIYAIIQVSDQLRALERMHQTRIDWLVACALDGRDAYLTRNSGTQTQPSRRSKITASVLFGAIRPTLRAWLTGELEGDLRNYADVVWDNIRPIFDAAQAYAATVSAALEAQPSSGRDNRV
jgi:AcrR family transcriptional regulator